MDVAAGPRRDARFTRVLQAVLVASVLVSIVHYVDNTVRYGDYAPDGGGLITAPVVAVSWFAFTAFGHWGYLSYLGGRYRSAAIGFAVYSGSGIVGIVHYLQVSPSDFDLLQNAFVTLDILLGLAVLTLAARLAWDPPQT